MYLIKRTKGPPPGPMDALTGSGPPAVHWAAKADADGHVVVWTQACGEACPLGRDLCDKVLAHYAGRPLAGTLEAVPYGAIETPPAGAPAATPEQPPDLTTAAGCAARPELAAEFIRHLKAGLVASEASCCRLESEAARAVAELARAKSKKKPAAKQEPKQEAAEKDAPAGAPPVDDTP